MSSWRNNRPSRIDKVKYKILLVFWQGLIKRDKAGKRPPSFYKPLLRAKVYGKRNKYLPCDWGPHYSKIIAKPLNDEQEYELNQLRYEHHMAVCDQVGWRKISFEERGVRIAEAKQKADVIFLSKYPELA